MQETRQEMVVAQTGGRQQRCSEGLDLEYSSKAEQTGFPAGLEGGCEREGEEARMTPKFLAWAVGNSARHP